MRVYARTGVLDDVIPPDQVDAVCEEVRDAPAKNRANKEAGDAGLRRSGRLKWPSEPVSDLVWMPQYAEHLGHPMVVAVAKAMLDDHIRIAQFNFRAIGVTAEEQLANPNRKLMREWRAFLLMHFTTALSLRHCAVFHRAHLALTAR